MSAGGASGRVFPLRDNQVRAVDPQESVWLSASAGTGKTQVLSARVLRLLLTENIDPSQILCLTFTKAGAAEMATRVNDVLANWVRMNPQELIADLEAIGAPSSKAMQSRARSLFARVLDCPGGGLRIDTIHAFAQWLLAAFPEEANLAPGTRAMEGRDRDLLGHQVLADMLLEWQKCGDTGLLDTLAMLSIRMGADGVRAWLMRCADAREVWFGSGAWQGDLEPRVRQLIGLGPDAGPDDLAQLCSDDQFDVGALRHCYAANTEWGTKTGLGCAVVIANWLAAPPTMRAEDLDALQRALFTQKNEPRALKSLEKIDPAYGDAAERVRVSVLRVCQLQLLFDLAAWLSPALQLGRRFALCWDEAKKREGLIDFDDQIRRAAALLSQSGMADWIRYKLDRQFDHILIDEAQDTNEEQWSIIRALTDDFFAGEGQRDDRLRTIFVVGDYKQAIFRFQGTSPENFEIARKYFHTEMAAAVRNAAEMQESISVRELKSLGLGHSFRTAQPVLDFVDAAIETIGFEAFGLDDMPQKHSGDDRAGEVVLWAPISSAGDDGEDSGDTENWISPPERQMADQIAAQVSDWLKDGYPLVKGGKRNAGPGDIMILVRKRRELAGLIVARLHAKNVPVAGVDRLRLGAPLAVKDLMAAVRFAAQPLDDLSLANVLVSPLIGWSQDDLLEYGYRDKGVALWEHLRQSPVKLVIDTAERLRDLLRLADFEPPQALLHWMLVGPWQGRKHLIARLGHEANDPIDELLNAAAQFTAAHTASLHQFIHWFDAGVGELKREAGASEGLVRVMTVHGSKGLQAPIVILADATGNPDRSPLRDLTLREDICDGAGRRDIPIPPLKTAEKAGSVISAEDAMRAEERQEHWRLLYVAMTRAEEALFIGGALGKREDIPAPDSWYAQLAKLYENGPIDDPIFGSRLVWGKRPPPFHGAHPAEHEAMQTRLPLWARTPIGPEPRPPRPLAPSYAGAEQAADPPQSPDAAQDAARRGVLIHSLLERLPEVAPPDRQVCAQTWLKQRAPDWNADQCDALIGAAMEVLDHPDFQDIFSPNSLAEVPLAATINGQVVTGVVDRLLVTKDTVTVVDYKTARRPPASLAQVPAATIRQMAAYTAALQAIYPGRTVSAAVLYTQTPILIEIPTDLLEANIPQTNLGQTNLGLSTTEQSYSGVAVE